jgi:lipid-A-disaccharide synthase
MGVPANVPLSAGDLPEALRRATIAITKTGTVTMECAYFGLPAVTLYRSTWINFAIARQIVTGVWTLTMPNLLAGESVYPEFLQEEATPQNLAQAAGLLLSDPAARLSAQAKLRGVIDSLGEPGAAGRAAKALAALMPQA